MKKKNKYVVIGVTGLAVLCIGVWSGVAIMWSRQNKTEESTTQETSEKTTEEKATDNTDTTQEEKNTLLFAEDTSETEDAVPEPWGEFLQEKQYEENITDWLLTDPGYCLLDIDQDGTEELILTSGPDADNWYEYQVYTAENDQNIELVDNIIVYKAISYSEKYKALVGYNDQPKQLTSSKNYYVLEDGKLTEDFSIGSEVDWETSVPSYDISDDVNGYTVITEDEYNTYENELKPLNDWKSLDTTSQNQEGNDYDTIRERVRDAEGYEPEVEYFSIDGFWYSEDYKYVYRFFTQEATVKTFCYAYIEGKMSWRNKFECGNIKMTSDKNAVLKSDGGENSFSPEVYITKDRMYSDELTLVRVDEKTVADLVGTWSDGNRTYTFYANGNYDFESRDDKYSGDYFFRGNGELVTIKYADVYANEYKVEDDTLIFGAYTYERQ